MAQAAEKEERGKKAKGGYLNMKLCERAHDIMVEGVHSEFAQTVNGLFILLGVVGFQLLAHLNLAKKVLAAHNEDCKEAGKAPLDVSTVQGIQRRCAFGWYSQMLVIVNSEIHP